jgi:hypothetical protein
MSLLLTEAPSHAYIQHDKEATLSQLFAMLKADKESRGATQECHEETRVCHGETAMTYQRQTKRQQHWHGGSLARRFGLQSETMVSE